MNILTPGQNEADELHRKYLEEKDVRRLLLAAYGYKDWMPTEAEWLDRFVGSIGSSCRQPDLQTPHKIKTPEGDWWHQKFNGNR